MVAATVLAAAGVASGTTALIAGGSPPWLAGSALGIGVAAIAGVVLAGRRVTIGTRFLWISGLIAIVTAVAWVIVPLSAGLFPLAWIFAGIAAVTVALAMICGLVDEDQVSVVLTWAAGLILGAGVIAGFIVLLASGRAERAWTLIAVLVVPILAVGATRVRPAAALRRTGGPGARIPPAVGAIGLVFAVGTSMLVAPALGKADGLTGTGASVAIVALLTAGQVLVQYVVIAALRPGVESIGVAYDRYGRREEPAWDQLARHSRLDSGIALSRVVAGSAVGSGVALSIADQAGYLGIPGLALILAVIAGRWQVAEAYSLRAMATTRRSAGPDYEWERLRAMREELSSSIARELRVGLDRLARQQSDALKGLNVAGIDDRAAELIAARVGDKVANAVESAMTGPALVNFTGYFLVELDGADDEVRRTGGGVIVAAPGAQVSLTISVVADQYARDAAPDRRNANESAFIALETVHIEGGKTQPEVEFDAIIDSATVTPDPHRVSMRLRHEGGEWRTSLTLLLPDGEGLHEAWIQLFQSGHLVQAIVVATDTRASSRVEAE